MKLNVDQQNKKNLYWKYYWRFLIIFCLVLPVIFIFNSTFIISLSYVSIFYLLGTIFTIIGIISYKSKYYVTHKFWVTPGASIQVQNEKGVFDKKALVLATRSIVFGLSLILVGMYLQSKI